MNAIENYFTEEKYESVLFVLVGIVAIVLAIYFFVKVKQPFYNGMSYPLIAIAFIQIVVGSTVFLRSPNDVKRVNEFLEKDQNKIVLEEIPRMNKVMKNFVLYRWIELSLIVVGLILFFLAPQKSFWKGLALGIIIQAGFMLLLDYFAESRGKIYLDFLNNFVK